MQAPRMPASASGRGASHLLGGEGMQGYAQCLEGAAPEEVEVGAQVLQDLLRGASMQDCRSSLEGWFTCDHHQEESKGMGLVIIRRRRMVKGLAANHAQVFAGGAPLPDPTLMVVSTSLSVNPPRSVLDRLPLPLPLLLLLLLVVVLVLLLVLLLLLLLLAPSRACFLSAPTSAMSVPASSSSVRSESLLSSSLTRSPWREGTGNGGRPYRFRLRALPRLPMLLGTVSSTND